MDRTPWRRAPLPSDPNLQSGSIGVPILPLPTLPRKRRKVDAEGNPIANGREPLPNGLLTTEAAVAKLKSKDEEKRVIAERKALRKRARAETKEEKEKEKADKINACEAGEVIAI